jgi:peroxiredoxin
MLITFWQSWSAPSLKELERLQRLCEHKNGDAPFVVAFHGGNDAKALEGIRKRYGLTFPIVQDVEQQVARSYGVGCWPTTVCVNAEGDIEHIQLGITHDHPSEPGRTTPDTAA